MCRLFALRSAAPVNAFRPLWEAPTALARQSVEHPDGWGIAHLERGVMRIAREVRPAFESERFQTHAKNITSELMIAHIRKASVGSNRLENTHPFTHDGWVFAHNGTVRRFDERRAEFERRIDPALRQHLTGETDSERCFFMFLTELRRAKQGDTLERAMHALAKVAAYTRESDPPDLPRPSVANFIATDGDRLVSIRFGKMLHFAAPGARGPLRDGTRVDSLLVASEPTDHRHAWRKLQHGQGVAIDRNLVLRRFSSF